MSQYYHLTVIIVWLGRQRTVFTRDITTIGELRWLLSDDLDVPVEDIGLTIAGDTLEDSDMLDWIDALDDPDQMLVAYRGALVINVDEDGEGESGDVSEHESEDTSEGESEDEGYESGDESEAAP